MVRTQRPARGGDVGRCAQDVGTEADRAPEPQPGSGRRHSSTCTSPARSPRFSMTWLAAFGMGPHLSYDPELPTAVLAANRESYGVAWPALESRAALGSSCRSARISWTAGARTCRSNSDWADARGKLGHAPRLDLHRRASIAHRTQCRRMASGQARLGARDRATLSSGTLGSRRAVTMAQAATASGVDEAVLTRLAAELAAAKPSLVLAGGSGGRRAGAGARGQRDQSGGGQRRPRSIPRERDHGIRTCRHATRTCAALVDRMNRGAVPHPVRARREPGVLDAQGAGLCRRDGAKCPSR